MLNYYLFGLLVSSLVLKSDISFATDNIIEAVGSQRTYVLGSTQWVDSTVNSSIRLFSYDKTYFDVIGQKSVTVSLIAPCDFYELAKAALEQNLDVPWEKVDRLVITSWSHASSTGACRYPAGVSTVGKDFYTLSDGRRVKLSVTAAPASASITTRVHELLHALGSGHADSLGCNEIPAGGHRTCSNGGGYGDSSNVMGTGSSTSHPNANQKAVLGWVNMYTVQVGERVELDIAEITQAGAGYHGVKVQRNGSIWDPYFFIERRNGQFVAYLYWGTDGKGTSKIRIYNVGETLRDPATNTTVEFISSGRLRVTHGGILDLIPPSASDFTIDGISHKLYTSELPYGSVTLNINGSSDIYGAIYNVFYDSILSDNSISRKLLGLGTTSRIFDTRPYAYVYFSATAVDIAGNGSNDIYGLAPSSNFLFKVGADLTPKDTEPPKVNILSPLEGQKIVGSQSVNVEIEVSDNVAIGAVYYYLNGNLVCNDSEFPYSCSFNIKGRTSTQELKVVVQDTSGNMASDSVKLTYLRR
jgi:hypothetical protein